MVTSTVARQSASKRPPWAWIADRLPRISDFGLLSVFGLRISDLARGFHCETRGTRQGAAVGIMDRALLCLFLCLVHGALAAQESWPAALSRMPLGANVTQLTRTNCVDVLWRAFQSNGVVKALILMPGATDTWYMLRPARVALTNANPSLLDAIAALTNQTRLRATFRPPMLLLHTATDLLEPVLKVEDPQTAARLKQARFVPHAVYNDRDWDFLQPILRKTLKTAMRPWRYSMDSWHFYRHTFAAWNLTGWEALEVTAMAAKTTCTVSRNKVVFDLDLRLPAPHAE